jgi:hypothetical protein
MARLMTRFVPMHSSLAAPTIAVDAAAARRKWRVFICLLLALYLSRGLMTSCVIPPFEMWDEYQHLAYIDHLSRSGTLPIVNQTPLPDDLLCQVVRWPQSIPAVMQLGGAGAVDYQTYWRLTAPPPYQPQPVRFYEAQQPPVYYWLMIPIYRLAGGADHAALAVAVLRLVNLAISAIGLAVVLVWIGRAFTHLAHAMIAGLWITLHPLLLLNSVRVANDALAVTLAQIAIVWCLSLTRRNLIWQCAAIAGVLSLAILTKPTDTVLVPVGLVCLLLAAARRDIPPWQTLAAAVAAAAVLLLSTLAYFRFNWHHYGLLVPIQEALANRQKGLSLSAYFDCLRPAHWNQWAGLLEKWFVSSGLWTGGWSFLGPAPIFTLFYQILIALAVLGWIASYFLRPSKPLLRCPRPAISGLILLCLGFAAEMIFHAIESFLAWGAATTVPWYAAAALPWLLMFLAVGALGWRTTRLGYSVALLMPALFAAAELHGIFDRMIRLYTQKKFSLDALHRLALLHPPFLGTATLLASTATTLVLLIVAAVMVCRMPITLIPSDML